MFKPQTEMEAIAVSPPQMRTVMNPTTFAEDPHPVSYTHLTLPTILRV